jgi:hypothetical protein
MIGALAARMRHLQVNEADQFRTLAEENRIKFKLIPPARGEVFDCNGIQLAQNIPTYQIKMVREDARDIDAVNAELSKIIDLDEESLAQSIAEMKRSAPFYPVTVADDVSWEDISRVSVNAPASAFEDISGPEQVFQDDIFRVKTHGYTILRGVWSEEQCAAARARLHVLQDTDQGMGQLYNKGEEFEGCYQAAPVLRLVRHFLGEDAVRSSCCFSPQHLVAGASPLAASPGAGNATIAT